ncbi:hypothetical protein BOTBODRAFT_505531 [Botryobasidium botryosum FD-172 SS1]|uniref:Uncharacterized protein n=1 Tax=Botryobasidium botryosum (strain FD-172 SS1) TaxID=930990 RepID=A0A067M5B8_BOTB1|nr:hypothetical protein BOTBODRAFT_505531 [Botryobasidium botryosum FD-172 SS1]
MKTALTNFHGSCRPVAFVKVINFTKFLTASRAGKKMHLTARQPGWDMGTRVNSLHPTNYMTTSSHQSQLTGVDPFGFLVLLAACRAYSITPRREDPSSASIHLPHDQLIFCNWQAAFAKRRLERYNTSILLNDWLRGSNFSPRLHYPQRQMPPSSWL